MRKKPHGSVGLGSLSLQELSQQPLHLPVSGVCTFHCLLRVKTIKRTQCILHITKHRMAVQGPAGHRRKKRETPNFNLMEDTKIGTSNDSAVMWRTTNMSARCRKVSDNLSTKKSKQCF